MLGAAHSAANPLTAHFGTPHGRAVGLMLPHVVRFNATDPEAAGTYAEFAVFAGISSRTDHAAAATENLAAHLEQLLDIANMPRTLKDCGAHNGDIARLAAEASSQWTAQFNPRNVTAADFQELYNRALA
jgi:alcohol dehydrogenase